MTEWEELAKEYKKELEALWKDMEHAGDLVYDKHLDTAIDLLDKSLDISIEYVRLLSYREPLTERSEPQFKFRKLKPKLKEVKNEKDRFKWLHSNK